MKSNRDNYINHMLDFIIKHLPIINILDPHQVLTIDNDDYNMIELLGYTIYHPLDILKLQPRNGAYSRESVLQFFNNLYVNYSADATDFSKYLELNEIYKINYGGSIPELDFFTDETRDIIKYRLTNSEDKTYIRGGFLIPDSGILPNTNIFMLSYKEEITKWINILMNDYLIRKTKEDAYDFFVPYLPFISYFTSNFVIKPDYYDIITSRFDNYTELKDGNNNLFIDYVVNNSIGDNLLSYNIILADADVITTVNNYYSILSSIMIYNYLDANTISDIINKNRSNSILMLGSISKSLYGLDDSWTRKLIKFKAIYNLYNNHRNYSERVYSYLGVLLFIVDRIQKYLAQIANAANLRQFDDILANVISIQNRIYNALTYTNITGMDSELVELRNQMDTYNIADTDKLIELTGNDYYVRFDNNYNGVYNPDNVSNDEIQILITNAGYRYNNDPVRFTDANRHVLFYQYLILLYRKFYDNIFSKYLSADKPDLIDDNLVTIQEVFFNRYNSLLINKSGIEPTIKIDVRRGINIYMNNINSNYNIFDSTTKINYKSFISLLPTLYYRLFYNQVTTPTTTVQTQTQTVTISNLQSRPRLTKNVSFIHAPTINNPQLSRHQPQPALTHHPRSIIINKATQTQIAPFLNIIYDLFWIGITFENFDSLPLFIRNLISECCLLLATYIVNDKVYCTTYTHALETNTVIDRICIIPYPYSTSETLFTIFNNVVERLRENMKVGKIDRTLLSNKSKHIGLSELGNREFINNLLTYNNMEDLIITYITIKTKYKNDQIADIDIDQTEEIKLVTVLMTLLGYSTNTTKLKNGPNTIYRITGNTSINLESLARNIYNEFKIKNSNKNIINALLKEMIPLINFLNSSIYKINTGMYTAAGTPNHFEYNVITNSDPIDMLNKIDLSSLISGSVYELLNTDIFNIDNEIFKKNVIDGNDFSSNKIISTISDNIPDSIYLKAGIYDKLYNLITSKQSAGISINDILDEIVNADVNENIISDVSEKEFLKKIISLFKKTSAVNLDINANVVKYQILNSLNCTLSKFSVPEKIPIHGLHDVKFLFTQLKNDGIEISPDIKEKLRTMIHDVYENTTNLIKHIAILGGVVEIVKAFKRLNKDISGSVIDINFIEQMENVFKDRFDKYSRTINTVYKNTMDSVFKDRSIEGIY
ncbi:precursor p4a of core protein 4a [Alphaentomopoxvirus acuprea]|uniref:Precursor p4a of core protein 4a n=1 Tax=Alphaentomopoxvirus acuprea TaxID=62099 RepID=W6JIU5_9POXV|nr:precursor p4a of core protein 4a [Anomala cuprea entomopoxvirus]BAO49503.1 precursor p4a of core protein 4a [Anomala cuprea entomopoxvirus]